MTISFLILVNKQGQTRLAKYFGETLNTDEKRALEGEIVRKCLARTDKQCSFFDHREYKVVYRRYASLFFMVGVDDEEVRPIAWMIQACTVPRDHGAGQPMLHPSTYVVSKLMYGGCWCLVVCTKEPLLVSLHPTVTCASVQNELAILEFIHCFVEVLDKHFGQVCELDIMNEPDMVSSSCALKVLSPAEGASRHQQAACGVQASQLEARL